VAKGGGWSILGRGRAQAPEPEAPRAHARADPPAVEAEEAEEAVPAAPALALLADRLHADEVQATLPRYFTIRDLLDAFQGKDPLLDAYVHGWLTPLAEQTLEANHPQLSCWLLARLIRLTLQPESPLP